MNEKAAESARKWTSLLLAASTFYLPDLHLQLIANTKKSNMANTTSPHSSPSADSAAMSESDAGDIDAPGSPEEDESAPLFPLEGKYLSASDRSDILGMPEIQREEILAERAQQVLKRQQDMQLRKALAAASTAANKHKRKAAAAELEDGGRRTRPKAEKAKTALDDYKRAREMKGTDRGRGADTGRDRRTSRSPSSAAGSDRDAEGESEVEWAEPADTRRGGREEAPPELRDFERCRVGRSNFSRVCFYPDFEDAIKGCFARVSIGMDRQTGQNQYRMTQIKSFTQGKPYQMEGSNGKNFTIDLYAVVAHGVAEKPWPFSACSDGKFTDQECDRYMGTLKKENMRVPRKTVLEGKLSDIHKLLNIEWTDESLSKKFANQRAMAARCDPANASRVKRDKIAQRKLEAEESGDAEEIMRCDAELAALENNSSTAVNGTSSLSSSSSNGIRPSPNKKPGHATGAGSGGSTNQDRLAALNQKNRGKNAEEVRRALIEERRKLQAAREQAAVEQKAKLAEKEMVEAAKQAKIKAEEEAKARLLKLPKDEMADLFGDGSDISRAGTPVGGGTPRRSRAGTPINGGLAVKKERSGLGQVGMKKKNLDDEVIGNLDLGIDVEI